MATVKQEAAQAIDTLADDATWEDALYAIYVRLEIAAGETDIAAGRTYSTEEVLKHLGLSAE